MKTALLLFAAAAFSFASCGGSSIEDKPAVEIVTKTQTGDVAKTVAHIQVQGIHCQDGCGGKIRAGLGDIACVADAQLVSFNAESPVNVVEVTYDPAMCDGQEMISTINGLSDGKFTVKAMEVTNFEAGS